MLSALHVLGRITAAAGTTAAASRGATTAAATAADVAAAAAAEWAEAAPQQPASRPRYGVGRVIVPFIAADMDRLPSTHSRIASLGTLGICTIAIAIMPIPIRWRRHPPPVPPACRHSLHTLPPQTHVTIGLSAEYMVRLISFLNSSQITLLLASLLLPRQRRA